jgi:phosphoribosylformylglycinamidine synthase subunit PurQ / glutaminase
MSGHGSSTAAGAGPSVLIPVAPGTNRNQELADAFERAGARTVQIPLLALCQQETKLVDHQILALPGGFSYGDALGAGRLLGLDLAGWFGDQLGEAVARSMPVIGICNGFQALVSAGLLPGAGQPAALVPNASGRFECRWVTLAPGPARSRWLDGLREPIRCPVAHGEGRLQLEDSDGIEAQVAFRYLDQDGSPASGRYPHNPNGSTGDVAGLVDATGLVLGLMPHPEDHVDARQDPQRGRRRGGLALDLFRAGVAAVG